MQLDLHLTNAATTPKYWLARHLVHEHGYVYPAVKDLSKWRKEQLVQAHEHAHEDVD